jgi:hypothetical protein
MPPNYGEYVDSIRDKVFNPSEYLEHVNNLNEEEREQRRQLFDDLFHRHGYGESEGA